MDEKKWFKTWHLAFDYQEIKCVCVCVCVYVREGENIISMHQSLLFCHLRKLTKQVLIGEIGNLEVKWKTKHFICVQTASLFASCLTI